MSAVIHMAQVGFQWLIANTRPPPEVDETTSLAEPTAVDSSCGPFVEDSMCSTAESDDLVVGFKRRPNQGFEDAPRG